jgi:hypothetical protein
MNESMTADLDNIAISFFAFRLNLEELGLDLFARNSKFINLYYFPGLTTPEGPATAKIC